MNFKFSTSSPCSFILSWVHEFIFWSWLNIRQRKPIMNVGLASCRYLLVASLSSLLLKSQPVLRSMANPGVSPNLFASSVNLGTDYISTMSSFSSVPIFPHDCRHPPHWHNLPNHWWRKLLAPIWTHPRLFLSFPMLAFSRLILSQNVIFWRLYRPVIIAN